MMNKFSSSNLQSASLDYTIDNLQCCLRKECPYHMHVILFEFSPFPYKLLYQVQLHCFEYTFKKKKQHIKVKFFMQQINGNLNGLSPFQDSMMECHKMDPEVSCPNLNCPPEKRLHIEGECCPVCEGMFCYFQRVHLCMTHVLGVYMYTCICA